MQINIESVVMAIGTVWLALKRINKFLDNLEKVAQPIVQEVEAVSKDGVIDGDDRKAVAIRALQIAEQEKTIKLNAVTRWLLKKVIDRAARKLPDYVLSQDAKRLVEKAVQ